jgi:exo-beta-1,3-glucanase (GH17 family)/cellulose synthase/poly-beta-1,6-N-acetylglucosamine synthase-like glycosyltransferase
MTQMIRKIAIFFVLILLVIINYSIWSRINNPLHLQPWTKTTLGVTYDPMRKEDKQTDETLIKPENIDADFSLLADKVHAIRTYTMSRGQDIIPGLAAKHNLNVTLGAWIGSDFDKNKQEIDKLVEIARQDHKNILRVTVGNETMLRKEVTEEQLIDYIRDVKKRQWRPVGTSETWDMWMAHPKLINEVDFIGVHILPYWEGMPIHSAVDYVFERYAKIKEMAQGKPVILTETGWPSDGQPFKHATASRANQAKFLREFFNRVDEYNQLIPKDKDKLNYYIVEAFDQPWKKSIEGSVGAYWGIFDADRQAKYPMDEDVVAMPDWENWASAAAVFSLVLMGLFLFTRSTLKLPGVLFFGLIANLAVSVIFWSASIGAHQYQTKLSIFFWGLMLLMQAMAVVILLIESLEIAEVIWHRKTARTFQPLTPGKDFKYPKVSLHLPIHNEPPMMVRKTLEALAKVDYPNLEVLVMDNNTKDPAVWEPVKADCERLGPMFRFFHLENWPGFKAGAINHALEQTDSDAEIIAVIDSDYILSPDWLKCMVPYFDNENVGFIQSPQDYRDRHLSTFKNFCYWEYAGFFNIGMVQRNEYNAIIQHGTMTMIRKSALIEVGNWAEWCICEDSELGLRLYEAGYDSVYVKDSFGKGLMPDTFSGYMTQRFRWVYGAMQIIKGHWRSFIPSKKSPLTSAQRYYFLAGWLPWFSDALALVFTTASLILTAVILYDPIHSELPSNVFLMPTVGIFSFKILRGLWLYQARVPCSVFESLGAALSGLALTHTVARGTIQGLFTSGKPFMRTPKYEKQGPLFSGLRTIQQEILMLILLGYAIWQMSSVEHFDNLTGKLWIAILSVQAVPYIATLLTILISVAPNYTRKGKLDAEELDDL